MKRFYTLFIIGALGITFDASSAPPSAETITIPYSIGTGFMINKDGDFVTNAHVLKQCESIVVRTERGRETATLTAQDEERDLAVARIESGNVSGGIAPLRWNIDDLRIGDAVEVIGYGGEAAAMSGRHTYKKTTVTDLRGVNNEPNFIQLASVVEHGSSGGPVLDHSGNVIAVIKGYAVITKKSDETKQRPTPAVKYAVAITLTSLHDFLNETGVKYYEAKSSVVAYPDSVIEANARQFIIPVLCVRAREAQ